MSATTAATNTPRRRLTHAIVRPPGLSFARAISSTRTPPDPFLARAEHTEYLQALAAAGLEVEVLPPDDRFPDSCFVQDPVLIIDGQAIITRMGAPTRRGEEESLGKALEGRFSLPLASIEAPGTLEGGDVLILPDRVVVGQSERTNKEGIAQLSDILAARGVPVTGVPLSGYLHLLSAVSYLGRGVMLAAGEDLTTHPALRGRSFEVIIAPPEEVYAVNTLAVGDRVIVPAGYPRVVAALTERGFEVLSVPVSQFAAADGGVTCLSLVW
jgi:dimethylargininase